MNEIGNGTRYWDRGKSQAHEKLNQELYDLLFDDIGYIIEYSKKYGVPMPKRER